MKNYDSVDSHWPISGFETNEAGNSDLDTIRSLFDQLLYKMFYGTRKIEPRVGLDYPQNSDDYIAANKWLDLLLGLEIGVHGTFQLFRLLLMKRTLREPRLCCSGRSRSSGCSDCTPTILKQNIIKKIKIRVTLVMTHRGSQD